MAIRYTLSLLLLALLVGCSAKTADKQSPDSSLAAETKTVPPPPPPSKEPDTTAQQQPPKSPEAVLMPLTPEPEHPSTSWPEYDRLVGTLETAVKHIYDSKGEVADGDLAAIREGLKGVAGSGGSDPGRKTSATMMNDVVRDMGRMQENITHSQIVPPGIKIDLVRMPITRAHDLVNSLPPEAHAAQHRRFEWMLVTLESAQRFADSKFDETRRKQ